jgi:hypothetical protein
VGPARPGRAAGARGGPRGRAGAVAGRAPPGRSRVVGPGRELKQILWPTRMTRMTRIVRPARTACRTCRTCRAVRIVTHGARGLVGCSGTDDSDGMAAVCGHGGLGQRFRWYGVGSGCFPSHDLDGGCLSESWCVSWRQGPLAYRARTCRVAAQAAVRSAPSWPGVSHPLDPGGGGHAPPAVGPQVAVAALD